MSRSPTKLHTLTRSTYLLGFWQVIISGSLCLETLVKDNIEDRVLLRRYTLGPDGSVKIGAELETPGSAKTGDGLVSGGVASICLENNAMNALIVCQSQGDGELSITAHPGAGDPRLLAGSLSPSDQWHVNDFLGPEEWLFSPSFRRGGADAQPIIANTADGRALFFGTDDPALVGFVAPDAFEPRACVVSGETLVAYRRSGGVPFYRLDRYSGPERLEPAPLIVTEIGGREANLSQSLGIGPVLHHTLVVDGEMKPWIFALREEAVGSTVLAMALDGQWVLRAALAVREELECLDAIWNGGTWSLVCAREIDDGRELLHRFWTP